MTMITKVKVNGKVIVLLNGKVINSYDKINREAEEFKHEKSIIKQK
jgi:hypothetical protein